MIILLLRQIAILLQSSECKTKYASVVADGLHVVPEAGFALGIRTIPRADTNRLEFRIACRLETSWQLLGLRY